MQWNEKQKEKAEQTIKNLLQAIAQLHPCTDQTREVLKARAQACHANMLIDQSGTNAGFSDQSIADDLRDTSHSAAIKWLSLLCDEGLTSKASAERIYARHYPDAIVVTQDDDGHHHVRQESKPSTQAIPRTTNKVSKLVDRTAPPTIHVPAHRYDRIMESDNFGITG